MHLLTAGGLIGTVASAHSSREAPTGLRVLGPLTDAAGTELTVDGVALGRAPHRSGHPGDGVGFPEPRPGVRAGRIGSFDEPGMGHRPSPGPGRHRIERHRPAPRR